MRNLAKVRAGFTMIEIMLVTASISILAGIVVVAVNPGKKIGETRNAARISDVNTIINAVYQYSLDNEGSFPASINAGTNCGVSLQMICATNYDCTGLTDLSTYVVGKTKKYLTTMPRDPKISSGSLTGYEIFRDVTANRITVCAPNTEGDTPIISASR